MVEKHIKNDEVILVAHKEIDQEIFHTKMMEIELVKSIMEEVSKYIKVLVYQDNLLDKKIVRASIKLKRI